MRYITVWLKGISTLLFLFCFFLENTWAESLTELADRINGKIVSEVAFQNSGNLSYDDLISTMPIRPGVVVNEQRLQEAIFSLLHRDVFQHIDVVAEDDSKAVKLSFLLTPKLTYQSVEFKGHSALDRRALSRISGIRPGRVFVMEDLRNAAQRIAEAYRTKGYYNPRLTMDIEQQYVAPQVIVSVQIDEGKRAEVSEVIILGTLPAELETIETNFINYALHSPAGDDEIKTLRTTFLTALRNEGYLSSYVRIESAVYQQETNGVRLELRVEPRKPLTLFFEGNNRFSTEELLTLLRMEKRTVPFSPDAIPTFVKNIKTFYQNHGFYETEVSVEKDPPQGDRSFYTITIDEGNEKYLGDISFTGNNFLSAKKLKNVVKTKPRGVLFLKRWQPGYLVEEQVKTDAQAITNLYRNVGYPDVATTYEVSKTSSNELKLIFTINEGKPSIISAVDLVWKDFFPRANESSPDLALLTIESQIKSGALLDTQALENERIRLLDLVRNQGLPTATVELDIDYKNETVHYKIRPGQRVIIGEIMNSGNIYSHDYVIQRELTFAPGELWSPEEIRRSEQALYQLGIFRSVSLEPRDGALDSAVEDMKITVEERNTGTFSLGASINTEDGLHLVGTVGQYNLGGSGSSLLLSLDGYFKTSQNLFDANRARLTYLEPRLFDTKTEWLNELFVQSSLELNNNFSYDRYGEAFTLSHPLIEHLFASIGYSVFYENVFDVEDDLIIGPEDKGNHVLSFLRTTIDFDKRDDKFNPRSGYRTWIEPRLSAEALGSAVDYYGVTLQQTHYYPLGEKLVWTNSVRATFLEIFGNTTSIPLSQRLFLGGRNSLRGFSPNAVGPRGFEGNIVGGDRSLVLNSELQYEVRPNVLAVFFLDAGQAVLSATDEFEGDPRSFSSLRYSPGLGLRYKTPIGPIGLDYGVALNREEGERFGRLHLSIGQSF